MPSIPLHILPSPPSASENPLPALLHTPSGLALLELQGTIHFPLPTSSSSPTSTTQVGKLVFPLYHPESSDLGDNKWMKRVYFYIGDNQRMTGECKKLPKPIAVVRKRVVVEEEEEEKEEERMEVEGDGEANRGGEELEMVEVVRYKVVFSARPEPVSDIVVEQE